MADDDSKLVKKYSRRNSGTRLPDGPLPTTISMEAKVVLSKIMVPSIDSPGTTYSEAQMSSESMNGSPCKNDDNNEICALCNCGSEMALILGQLTRYSVSPSTFKKLERIKSDANRSNSSPLPGTEDIPKKDLLKDRTFYKRRRRKPFAEWESNLPPDMTTFGTAHMQEFSDILDRDGCLWAHHCCAAWSTGVCQTDSYDLENVDRAVAKALMKKCSHCQRYGASIECQVHRCNKIYHYPCCASAGAFQNITSMILLCTDHLDRAEKIPDAEAFCDSCQKKDNMNLQLFCTSCGRHFHSYCVEMTIPITPVVRMGWQCSFCKVCQGCKQPGDEDKMLCCDHCDKGYHTYCLNPPISSVPKSSWKCISCRKCDDCGSTRAGGGPSCRWHHNYTLCDRCYQQRKKGQCCPLCNRAIRLFNNGDILQCTKCFKCVHSECDPDGAEAKKYICSTCQSLHQNGIKVERVEYDSSYEAELAATGQKSISEEEAKLFSMAASAEFISKCTKAEFLEEEQDEKFMSNDDYYGNKFDEKMSESTYDSPYSSVISESFNDLSIQSARKKDESCLTKRLKKSFRGRRFRGSSYSSSVLHSDFHGGYRKDIDSSMIEDLSKSSDIPSNAIEEEGDETGNGEESGGHSTVVIVSSTDSFSLKQDICTSCGSLGKGKDGYLIGCVQCGQCYHPYCVDVKINEVILDRGWRCLDCTVCEGCGRNGDEAHLLLCDICDVSFHTYCLDPPLQDVPVGGWKCHWCAVCEDCGVKDPGFNCQWMANYTQCGPCSSEQYCSICSYAYEPNNLVIQCEKCERWLHGECDGLFSESDANLACSLMYHCLQCRPVTKHLGIYSNLKTSIVSKVIKKAVTDSLMQQASPPVIKKPKPLQIKVKKLTRLEIKEQKRAELEAMPLIPNDAATNECGTFGIDLGLLKGRLRMDDIAKPSFNLTEAGMKQIKSQVIRAPITRTIRKPRKSEDQAKGNAIMLEEVSCSNDGNEEPRLNEQDNDVPDELESLGVESDILSPDLIKREDITDTDGMQPDTTEMIITDDSQDAPDLEDVTDPFEFFGVNLLERQLHLEIESEELISNRKKMKKEKRKEKRLRKAAKLAEAARLAFDGPLRAPSVPDPTAAVVHMSHTLQNNEGNVASSSVQVVPTTPISVTSPIATAPPPFESELEEEAQKASTQQQITNQVSVSSVDESIISSNSSVITSSIHEPNLSNQDLKSHPNSESLTDISDPNTLDLHNVEDLPHVEGHEVEQLFAGIEQERVGPEDKQKYLGDDLPVSLMENVSDQLLAQDGNDDLAKLNMNPLLGNHCLPPDDANSDVFKAVFGEHLPASMPIPATNTKKGSEYSHTKIDTQKQLKKWEQDEKLGENATISPVLYANLVHKNLVNEYKDWSSRARAIARLWRKLPSDQREPFRLRARDNRVKKKGANKSSLITQQMISTASTTTEVVDTNSLTSGENPMLPPPVISPDGENSLSSDSNILHKTPNMKSEASMMSTPTIMTVSEPQKLSPLLNNLSPSISMSSMSGMTPTSPVSPSFFPNTTTATNDQAIFKSPAAVVKAEKPKPKRPKMTKEEREQKKLQKKMQTSMMLEKEKQWKLLQTQKIFEQQRLEYLQGSKPLEQQMQHPSVRFRNNTGTSLNPAFPDDPMQHLINKMHSEQAKLMNPPPREIPSSTTVLSTQNNTGFSNPPVNPPMTTSTPSATSVAPLANEEISNDSISSVIQTPPKSAASKKDEQIKKPSSPSNIFDKNKTDFPHIPDIDSAVRSNLEMQRQMENDMFFHAASSLDRSSMRNAEEQSYLLHQQQYMASQQQYIQWQLAQQQLYGSTKPVSNQSKDISEIDSEEKHQERIRYLYHQRQFGKDPMMYNMSSTSAESIQSTTQTSQNTSSKVASNAQSTTESLNQPQVDNTPSTSTPLVTSTVKQPPMMPHPQSTNPNSHMFAGDFQNQGYPSSFPANMNPAESAMYHQMLLEYMRCRKYDMDPNMPPVQLYNNMAELAKQYFQRQPYPGKIYPPGMPSHSQRGMYPPYPQAMPPTVRPYYDERVYQKNDFLQMGGGMYHPRGGAMHETPTPPTPSTKAVAPMSESTVTSYSKNKITLQKSASFEISRIAADSTSNDDVIEPSDQQFEEPSSTFGDSSHEEEITSSKLSEPHDAVKNPDSNISQSNSTKDAFGADNQSSSVENESENKSVACSDGIHHREDDEDETEAKSGVCSDGIHCGTDDEDEAKAKSGLCSDGIHCGTDDEDETKAKSGVCSDGIHCGTDDEDETKAKSGVCSDGIHCGTDDEDETKAKSGVCSDGIHCGTDDEDETKAKSEVCSDGIHCGTDDEDETKAKSGVCSDGIHCGTDDEDETKMKGSSEIHHETKIDRKGESFNLSGVGFSTDNSSIIKSSVIKSSDKEDIERKEGEDINSRLEVKSSMPLVQPQQLSQKFNQVNIDDKASMFDSKSPPVISSSQFHYDQPFGSSTGVVQPSPASAINVHSSNAVYPSHLGGDASHYSNPNVSSASSSQSNVGIVCPSQSTQGSLTHPSSQFYNQHQPSANSFQPSNEFSSTNKFDVDYSSSNKVPAIFTEARFSPANQQLSNAPKIFSSLPSSSPMVTSSKSVINTLPGGQTSTDFRPSGGDMNDNSNLSESRSNMASPAFMPSSYVSNQLDISNDFLGSSTSDHWPSSSLPMPHQNKDNFTLTSNQATADFNGKTSSDITNQKTSTTPIPKSPFSQSSSPAPKANIISLHPGSPQYLQIFIYQHQLLIMQFQQYQFQLQAQYHQLSQQQQMSSQQQFLLQQQFHQQMVLLQQQFIQQQAQLHRMAASGIQFTEHQLNSMVQQQMLTQQNYRQWVMALSPEQQIHLQQRMQANMQQVQHQMSQIIQHARQEDEQKKKPKARRLNKKKSTSSNSSVNSLVLNEPAAAEKSEPPPRFPVPELSEEMKRAKSLKVPTINTCTAEVPPPSIATPTSTRFNAPISMPVKIETLESGVIKEAPVRPLMQPPHQFLPSGVSEPTSTLTAIKSPAIKSPTMKSPIGFVGDEYIKKKADTTVSSTIGGIPPSRYENIQESFLKQQQLVKEAAKQKAEQSSGARNVSRQTFFPIHPSQILANAKSQGIMKSSPVKSPTTSNISSPIITEPQSMTSPFHSHNTTPSLNSKSGRTVDSTLKKTLSPSSILSSPRSVDIDFNTISTPSSTVFPTTSARSTFSVTDLLNSGPSKYGEYGVIKQASMDQHAIPINTISKSEVNLLTEAGLMKTNPDGSVQQQIVVDPSELLKKASMVKPPKVKKDNKLMEEKKRLRELERQKKKDEKIQLRLLKEKKKAEKQQQKLIKQKALQEAKLLASNNKKQRQKVPPVPIPDMPSSDKPVVVSPTSATFMQKSPTLTVTPKIPLCEPDVHLVYPLAQPVGFSRTYIDSTLNGDYGFCEVNPADNVYKEEHPNALLTSGFIEGNQVPCDVMADSQLFQNQLSSTLLDESTAKILSEDRSKPVDSMEIDSIDGESAEKRDNDEKRADTDDESTVLQNEFMNLLRCNQCYTSFSANATCWMLDKKIEMIYEVDVDFNEISISDHFSFCSHSCSQEFQRKCQITSINHDFEFVDAIKTAAMVTLNESHTFLPLPNERGEIFAQGMNITKLNQDMTQRRWKRWSYDSIISPTKKRCRHRLSKEDMELLMSRFDVRLRPSDGIRDYRSCVFCLGVGDGEPSLQSRLLNYDVGIWVHLNCALWSSEVYESLNGGLNRVDKAYERSRYTKCVWCEKLGATLHCSQTFGVQQRSHCEKTYHFTCAHYSHCTFYKDKTILCADHKIYGNPDEELRTFSVRRKVYVERDLTKQIAKMFSLNNDFERKEYTFRVGNRIFHELGQIPLDLLPQFSTSEYVYPIGFETTLIYWDYTNPRQRRYYTCSIYERFRSPRFRVTVHSNGSEGIKYSNCAARGAWDEIISNIQKQREKEALLKIFPEFICGEDLFGLSEPTIQRIIESLPGIDTIATYNFRFGRTPLLIAQLPLALNPTGCIRSEKVRKPQSNRPLAIRHASDSQVKTQSEPNIPDESWLTYSQRSIHSTKSGQYRRMRQEWRNNVVLGRSRIQGLGLFVKKDIEENTFIIEYIGSLIRNEVANRLEKLYERQNRGIYMFRIDSEVVVDATMTGGPARYINHSCEPNCVAEIVNIEKDKKIIIISNRRIEKGEELTYDYKLELEDDKIACLCGSSICRKWMN